MKRFAILIAVTALAVGALFAGQAGADGGNGASFCSTSTGGFNPGGAVIGTGNPLLVALVCNPNVGL